MKNVILLIFGLVFVSNSALHKNARTTQVHSPFRWVFADSAARVAESVTTSDTDKVAYQKSDSSIWVLRDNSPKTWIELNNNFGNLFADSLNLSRGAAIGQSISVDSNVTIGKNLMADSINTRTSVIGKIDCELAEIDSLEVTTNSVPCTLTVYEGVELATFDTVGTLEYTKIGNMVFCALSGFSVLIKKLISYDDGRLKILNFPQDIAPSQTTAIPLADDVSDGTQVNFSYYIGASYDDGAHLQVYKYHDSTQVRITDKLPFWYYK